MRRLASFSVLFLAFALVVPAPVAARTVTTYTTVNCWIGWEDPYWRPTGHDGLVEHDGAVIYNDVWVHDASGWRSVGTEVDTVMVESNARTGVELFRGSFIVTSTLGDFRGSFVWTENNGGGSGQGVGIATDGSGRLWKSSAGVVDPATTGVPACAAEREVYNLTRLEIVAP